MRSFLLALLLAAPFAAPPAAQPAADTFGTVTLVSQDQGLKADAHVGTYAAAESALRVTPAGDGLVFIPTGQAAFDVFADDAADASLNSRAEALLRDAFAGDFALLAAALPARRREAGTQDFARMLAALSDQRGAATSVVAFGTTAETPRRAATLVRVTFAEGDELLKLVWRADHLALITRGVLPQFSAQPVPSEQHYVVVGEDNAVRAVATFDGERVTVQSPAHTFTAERVR